jgi:hypothetical protein
MMNPTMPPGPRSALRPGPAGAAASGGSTVVCAPATYVNDTLAQLWP